ncbi:toll-like receptor 4 [Mytilus galloprovincialis]|uniref:toll-like receptor 4 n=1 Tax=Mytilus galloprovincialis TaxID=29158 RepID=UPI003F7CA869
MAYIFLISIITLVMQGNCEEYNLQKNNQCKYWRKEKLLHIDCTNRNMSTIETFPADTAFLNLGYNRIKQIDSGAFKYSHELVELDLSDNIISQCDRSSFEGLHKLRRLYLNSNHLNYSLLSIPEGIFKPLLSLTYLNIKDNLNDFKPNIEDIVMKDLRELESLEIDVRKTVNEIVFGNEYSQLRHLKQITFGICLLWGMDNHTFENLPYLKYIHATRCNIVNYHFKTLSHRKQLRFIDFSYSLTGMDDKKRFMSDMITTGIKIIKLTNCNRTPFEFPYIFFHMLSRTVIEELYLSNNLFSGFQDTTSFPGSLRVLDFSSNRFTTFQQNLTNLFSLFLQNNTLGPFLRHNRYFSSKTSCLKQINLASNFIGSLKFNIFHHQPLLIEVNLSYNIISEITFDLAESKNLQFLDLSGNFFRAFNETTMTALSSMFETSSLKISLKDNPLRCSCFSLPFLEWMLDNQDHFYSIREYKCIFDNNTEIVLKSLRHTVLQLKKNCASYTAVIALVSVAVAVSLVVLSGGLAYRYRWKIRYAYHITKKKYWRHLPSRQESHYEYNAFISFAEKDRDFILKECIPNLEAEENIKLCIHCRDFLPGEEITTNITNAIHQSGKTICLISKAFLESYYCNFEFNMARMESIHGRNGEQMLFLIFYEQVKPQELPLVMLELIDRKSYIEYPNDEQGNVVFWAKLKESLSIHHDQ